MLSDEQQGGGGSHQPENIDLPSWGPQTKFFKNKKTIKENDNNNNNNHNPT